MKKEMTLAEVKSMYGDACFETETSFGVNKFGKYSPNMTFIIPKTFNLGKDGKPISPIGNIVTDEEVISNMNVDFDGSVGIVYGDFWRSKKGGACFRPKDPMQAKHMLLEVGWGGCFNSHRGNYPSEVERIEGVLYFRRASSNGGGVGTDYWVVPVGFTRVIHDAEIDGGTDSSCTKIFEERAKVYRKKHSDLLKKKVEDADVFLREKAAAEEASKSNKDKFVPRLTEIRAELVELAQPKKFGRYGVSKINMGEVCFKLDGKEYLYNEESLSKAEEYLSRIRNFIDISEVNEQSRADAREKFVPKYEELRKRIEALGWELSFDDKTAEIKTPIKRYGISYRFDLEGLEDLRNDIKKEEDRVAEEDFRRRNAERIKGLLSKVKFPEELWFLFEGSEDLDSVILKEAEAIMAAVEEPKDEMDIHELCNCGYVRRCEAIRRVLERVGGGVAKIDIDSQANSKELAWFIAG